MITIESEHRIKPTLLIHSFQGFKIVRRWNTWRFGRVFASAKEGDVIEIPAGNWCLEAALRLGGWHIYTHEIFETGPVE